MSRNQTGEDGWKVLTIRYLTLSLCFPLCLGYHYLRTLCLMLSRIRTYNIVCEVMEKASHPASQSKEGNWVSNCFRFLPTLLVRILALYNSCYKGTPLASLWGRGEIWSMCQVASQLSTLLQVIFFSSIQSVITKTYAFQQNFVTIASYPIFFALVDLCLLKKFLFLSFQWCFSKETV